MATRKAQEVVGEADAPDEAVEVKGRSKVEKDEDGNLRLAGSEERLGIDPDTQEVVSVTVETLMVAKDLSRKDAEELYLRVAKAGHFFNPDSEPYDYRPALGVHGLRGNKREAVDKLLAA